MPTEWRRDSKVGCEKRPEPKPEVCCSTHNLKRHPATKLQAKALKPVNPINPWLSHQGTGFKQKTQTPAAEKKMLAILAIPQQMHR